MLEMRCETIRINTDDEGVCLHGSILKATPSTDSDTGQHSMRITP